MPKFREENWDISRPSSKKKPKKRTKKITHKHSNEQVLVFSPASFHLQYRESPRYRLYPAEICKICRKISKEKMFVTEPVGSYVRMLSAQEVFEKYSDLKIITAWGGEVSREFVKVSLNENKK